MDLQEIRAREDYTFVGAVWWVLSQFVRDMNFVTILSNLKKNGTIQAMYDRYPERYRPLVDPIFNYIYAYLDQQETNSVIYNPTIKR